MSLMGPSGRVKALTSPHEAPATDGANVVKTL